MTEHHTNGDADEVEAVVQAFVDYLDGVGPEPTLDHLDEAERQNATALIESLRAGRGMDPYASRPSIEALLAGTDLEGALVHGEVEPPARDLAAIRDLLAGVEARARVEVERSSGGTDTVLLGHLDLRVRFLLVDGLTPAVTDAVRGTLQRLLLEDPDVEYFGVVAAGDEELSTQLLAAADLGPTPILTESQADASWLPVLPLSWAARRVVELGAPEWESFEFDNTTVEPLDVEAVTTQIAREVIAREAGRAYRGEKARAYKSLIDREAAFAGLVEQVATRGAAAVDLEAEALRIAWEAA